MCIIPGKIFFFSPKAKWFISRSINTNLKRFSHAVKSEILGNKNHNVIVLCTVWFRIIFSFRTFWLYPHIKQYLRFTEQESWVRYSPGKLIVLSVIILNYKLWIPFRLIAPLGPPDKAPLSLPISHILYLLELLHIPEKGCLYNFIYDIWHINFLYNLTLKDLITSHNNKNIRNQYYNFFFIYL